MALLKATMRLWQPAVHSIPVAGAEGTIATGVIDTKTMRDITLLLKLIAPDADADVAIDYATSADGVTFTTYDNSVSASTATAFAATPENLHEYALAPKARYIKIQLTNAVAQITTVEGYLQFTEEA